MRCSHMIGGVQSHDCCFTVMGWGGGALEQHFPTALDLTRRGADLEGTFYLGGGGVVGKGGTAA